MTSVQSLYTSRIREYLRRLERGDASAIAELFAPDAQVRIAPGGPWRWPAARQDFTH